ncbi:DNA recombination protein RmuC [Salipiger sp. IMCC34102]|uniref:DNA recombination protein RmuC n=1 Tax=Salipiger sp. IMCC34102 TaxID=2510647 RepID=UPI00101C7EBE|nr:DNA recombination protein RmuC [Salipiger sp. IMCC34102]RYH01552.1 DNA recombination protein RmuC [Salipiger sp. IMCC34102]
MIEIGNMQIATDDPRLWAAVLGVVLIAALFWLLIATGRRANRSGQAVDALAGQVGQLSVFMQDLGSNQTRLSENLRTVADTQASGQTHVIQTMERRLSEVTAQVADRLSDTNARVARQLAETNTQVAERLAENALKSARTLSDMQERMTETLSGSSEKSAKQLTELQERLATIDRAQSNIEKLSGDVLSLQDILSNKQTRGAFGEIQLTDIVGKALPSDSYTLQATLSNGKRADCLIHLPNPPGPIVVDAKFPLEAYETLARAEGRAEQEAALKQLGAAVRVHIKAITEKYIIEGETADGAIMFLPSEAVYAELHARLPQVVREGFAARVWIVSPTTCMATLNTMRAILKDARMREQTGAIRKSLKQLHRDVELIGERAGKLETHLRQANDDVSGILTASTRAGKRADRLDNFDFEELSAGAPEPLPLADAGANDTE